MTFISLAVASRMLATVEMLDARGLLLGEHFSVDGTLTQAWSN